MHNTPSQEAVFWQINSYVAMMITLWWVIMLIMMKKKRAFLFWYLSVLYPDLKRQFAQSNFKILTRTDGCYTQELAVNWWKKTLNCYSPLKTLYKQTKMLITRILSFSNSVCSNQSETEVVTWATLNLLSANVFNFSKKFYLGIAAALPHNAYF